MQAPCTSLPSLNGKELTALSGLQRGVNEPCSVHRNRQVLILITWDSVLPAKSSTQQVSYWHTILISLDSKPLTPGF